MALVWCKGWGEKIEVMIDSVIVCELIDMRACLAVLKFL